MKSLAGWRHVAVTERRTMVDFAQQMRWWVYLRFYAPTQAYFDKSWAMPDFEKGRSATACMRAQFLLHR